jgi:hypothetical protein
VRLSLSHLKRGDRIGILLMLAFFGFLFLVALFVPHLRPSGRANFNFGFSQDLQCDSALYLEPVCVRKPPKFPQR